MAIKFDHVILFDKGLKIKGKKSNSKLLIYMTDMYTNKVLFLLIIVLVKMLVSFWNVTVGELNVLSLCMSLLKFNGPNHKHKFFFCLLIKQ